MLRARLFGTLAIDVDGRPVPAIVGLKPRSVLAWLLLHAGTHSRAHLAARFWPEVLDTSARASLRSALWTIREGLDQVGGSRYLEADRETVGIPSKLPHEIDAVEFDRLAASDDPVELERAVALAEEPLLADLADEWVLEARDEYHERAAAVALRLAKGSEAAGDGRAAVEWTRRALGHVRFQEAAHRMLMRRLAAIGERAEALRAYARYKAILSAEFGTTPSPETRALVAELRRTADFEEVRPLLPPRAAMERRRATPLVGRREEFGALAAAWDAALEGRGGVVLVTGAAGIGKSRLAAELVERAASDGAQVASGVALELAGAPPLAPWSELLHGLVVGSAPPAQELTWPCQLARLCPSVELRWGVRAAPPASDPDLERTRLFQAVVEAIEWSARQRPVLLLLEDLHLVDRATVRLLAFVASRLLAMPAVLLATRRSATTREDLELALQALARRGAVTAEVGLEPLSESETAALVDATAPRLAADRRAWAIAAAEGNPFLARVAARAAQRETGPTAELRPWVRAALAGLGETARLLVDLAACAGRPLDAGEAADLVGAEDLPDALAAAREAELLEVREGRRIGFVHTLVREACYENLDEPRRLLLHRRLADLLRARPRRSVAEIARHLLRGGDQEEARSYLAVAAAEARSLGALDEAAGFLREAAEMAGETPALAAELWLALADVESFRGNRAGHDAASRCALAVFERESDPVGLAGAYLARGRCLRTTLCYPREALAAYERALEIIDRSGIDTPELRALALGGLAWAEAASGDTVRAEALAASADTLPESQRDPVLAAELALTRATAAMRAGRFREAVALCERAAAIAMNAGRPDLAYVALNFAASAVASTGDFAATLEYADAARRAGRVGTALEGEALAARAYALARLGRHDEAQEAARDEEGVLGRSGDAEQEALAAFDAGSIALAAGRYGEAVRRLNEALEYEGARLPRAFARLRLGEARLAAGDVEGAARELARFPFEPVAAADLPEALVHRLERLQGLVARARGEREAALRRLAEAETGWRRLLACAPTGELLAASLVDLGRAPVAGLVEPGVELGRVLAERALVLAEDGRAAEAAAASEEAAELAGRLSFAGYDETLERVEEMLRSAVTS